MLAGHRHRRHPGDLFPRRRIIERYRNKQGQAGITAFETGVDWIEVQFRSGQVYRYTRSAAGAGNIEEMKALAHAGRGLSTFITRHAAELEGAPMTTAAKPLTH